MRHLERAGSLRDLEKRYQAGLVTMVNFICGQSPDVVFYPGDSAIRMAGELETVASNLGVTLPSGIQVPHALNRRLYTENPLEIEGLLKQLVRPDQRIVLADDTAEFGDKLYAYDLLFRWAEYQDVALVAMVASERYKFNRPDSPYHVLFHDEELFYTCTR